jgi:hypothetical protein
LNLIDEEKKLSEYNLQPGDIIFVLNETISLDQPLTLDEVRDFHTYPLLMHRLVEYSHPEYDFDFIVLALHALMLESGFQMVKKKIFFFHILIYRILGCGKRL